MGFNLGLALSSAAKAAGPIRQERKQRKLEDLVRQQQAADRERKITLEDQLHMQRDQDRARQAVSQDLLDDRVRADTDRLRREPTQSAQPLEVVIGPDGKRVYAPRAEAVGKQAPAPAEPLVVTTTPEGGPVYTRRDDAVGMGAPQPASQTGGPDKRKRMEALRNVASALDSFEQNLSTTGSAIMPGVDKDVLQTDYENLQLQLKELFNLGVLNGPDLALMRRIIADPTGWRGRALAMGDAGEQTKRVMAQVQKMREKLASFEANVGGGQPDAAKGRDVTGLLKKYGLEP